MKKPLRNLLKGSFIILAVFCMISCSGPDPVKIYIMAGQSNMEGPGKTNYLRENKLTSLLEERDDVWCVYAGRVTGPLLPEFGFRRNNFGPELLFGHEMGDTLENDIANPANSGFRYRPNAGYRSPAAIGIPMIL